MDVIIVQSALGLRPSTLQLIWISTSVASRVISTRIGTIKQATLEMDAMISDQTLYHSENKRLSGLAKALNYSLVFCKFLTVASLNRARHTDLYQLVRLCAHYFSYGFDTVG
ncbi:hypothetical protein RRG08_063622 [Elysia crispata]|uniref:Uncharacterized protein n=1 Tax=Elysia crispata TaxID=231223 RepID=A0AAE1DZ54_9GAST|nr:hypothetical protein RRG08_063622 [Elysia crispata]